MRNLISQKFSHGTDFANMLIATYSAKLIEGNTWNDTIWGVCNGAGKNILGILLMNQRSNLMNLQDSWM